MAEIGKLVVKLELATNALQKGLADTRADLKRFGDAVSKSFTAAKPYILAAGAAATGMAIAVGVAVNRTLANFDRLAKQSRALSIPVEQLSALTHAAELSGLTSDELGRAFQTLARNMLQAAEAPNTFSRSLEAMGVVWRDATGQFRDTDALLLDLADKFANMEDGAAKTALAMKIFGEEGGPKLMSLLSNGSAGIRAMTEEAKELNLVVSTQAAVASEQFNDTMSRIAKVSQGFTNELTVRLLPALNQVAQKFLNWAKNSNIAKGSAETLANAVKGLIEVFYNISAAVEVSGLAITTFFENVKSAVTGSLDEIAVRNFDMATKISAIQHRLTSDVTKLWQDLPEIVGESTEKITTKSLPPLIASMQSLTDEQAQWNEAWQESRALFEATRTPMEALMERQARINELMQLGVIDAETYQRAMAQASAISANNMDALAGQVSSALGVIFKDSKAAAIAQALINTYQGISRAISAYPPPISTAMAAIQAAMGFAQVASIRSTSRTGGGGSGSSGAAAAGAAAPTQIPQVLSVQGLSGDTLMRSGDVGVLAERLLQYQRDGGQVVIAR